MTPNILKKTVQIMNSNKLIFLAMLVGLTVVVSPPMRDIQAAKNAENTLEIRAAKFGVEIQRECYEDLFGSTCKPKNTPLTAAQLTNAIAILSDCEVGLLKAQTDAGNVVGILTLLVVEQSCADSAARKIVEQRNADSLDAQRAVLANH